MPPRDIPTIIDAIPTRATKDQVPEGLLAYWRVVQGGLEQARQEITQAQELEAQAQQLRQSAVARVGAFESYAAHVAEVLGLNLATDRIEPDGTIVRGPTRNGSP